MVDATRNSCRSASGVFSSRHPCRLLHRIPFLVWRAIEWLSTQCLHTPTSSLVHGTQACCSKRCGCLVCYVGFSHTVSRSIVRRMEVASRNTRMHTRTRSSPQYVVRALYSTVQPARCPHPLRHASQSIKPWSMILSLRQRARFPSLLWMLSCPDAAALHATSAAASDGAALAGPAVFNSIGVGAAARMLAWQMNLRAC